MSHFACVGYGQALPDPPRRPNLRLCPGPSIPGFKQYGYNLAAHCSSFEKDGGLVTNGYEKLWVRCDREKNGRKNQNKKENRSKREGPQRRKPIAMKRN